VLGVKSFGVPFLYLIVYMFSGTVFQIGDTPLYKHLARFLYQSRLGVVNGVGIFPDGIFTKKEMFDYAAFLQHNATVTDSHLHT
jgi:hypothetical protein